MIIRPLKDEELLLAFVIGELFHKERKLDGKYDPIKAETAWKQFKQFGVDAEIFGAFDEDHLVGGIGLIRTADFYSDNRFVQEAFWFVSPEYRNGTVGPRLLLAAEKWAAGMKLRMSAFHQSDFHTLARFYEKRGYVQKETLFEKDC